jgi:hypothetical protein
MIQTFAYAGSSGVVREGDGRAIRFAPNLAREPVAFDAELKHPLRFREAVSALHDVVVSDLRFAKKDKTAYLAWKKQQAAREAALRREAYREADQRAALRQATPLPAGFEGEYDAARKQYWDARVAYSKILALHDPALWRKLMPCDPIITVADDVVFFECFSKDESAYGHLSVGRGDGFGSSPSLKLGTTNVDYSQELYEEFQTLRTYRPTRFNLDPEGFTVKTGGAGAYREEKIDLPTSWLRGLMKLQAAMTMPAVRVRLTREAVYSLLAFLKRHRARKSPRALRFELEQGKPPRMVMEPWEKAVQVVGPAYDGPATAPVRVWGTRRLLVLARLLPLADSVDVHLLATGLPSFWVVRAGEMVFTLGLSGWTTNDWSAGSALDLLQPPRAPTVHQIDRAAAVLKDRRAADLPTITREAGEADPHVAAAALRHLAQTGQVIYDLAAGVYRYRQIMSQPVGEAQLGPEDPELAGARDLVARRKYELLDRQDGPNLTRVLVGKVEGKPVEVMVDADDRIKRGKCLCGHFQKYGLRNGPCRHMIALRWGASLHGLKAYEMSGSLNRLLGREG